MITTEQVKELRNRTGISVMQCKKALEEARGNIEKAVELLKKSGREVALRKAGRELGAGVIASYIHSNSGIGVLVELLCETDFVAKNKEFRELADDLAMHIAAMNPEFIKEENISEDNKKKARELFSEEVKKSGKPDNIKSKMLDGKVYAYFRERTLLDQSFVKEPEITVGELIERATQKIGEKIEVSRFIRYSLLEE